MTLLRKAEIEVETPDGWTAEQLEAADYLLADFPSREITVLVTRWIERCIESPIDPLLVPRLPSRRPRLVVRVPGSHVPWREQELPEPEPGWPPSDMPIKVLHEFIMCNDEQAGRCRRRARFWCDGFGRCDNHVLTLAEMYRPLVRRIDYRV
jgi:hypothetical protein